LPASFKGQKLAHKKKSLASCGQPLALLALYLAMLALYLAMRLRFILVAQITIQRDSHFLRASFFLLIASPLARKFSCAPELAFKLVFFVR
jgi:hypothetical protein